MSERDNIELVKRCYSDFLDGHTQQALDLFADDLDFPASDAAIDLAVGRKT